MNITFKIRGGKAGGGRGFLDRKSFPPHSAHATTNFYTRRIHT